MIDSLIGPLPPLRRNATPNEIRKMAFAIEEAKIAESKGEVPIGAVIFFENNLIAKAHNLRESLQDPTAHAELLAIKSAANLIGSWRLVDCELYVTLEPCPMCAGAIVNARLTKCVFGASDPKGGAVETLYQLLCDKRLNHQPEVVAGVLDEEASGLLTSFFRSIRRGKGGKKPLEAQKAIGSHASNVAPIIVLDD